MSKEVILTAPRLSNELHLGNYLGALLPMADMAKQKSEEYQFNLFVADLHGITTPTDYKAVQPRINQYLRMFVAAGFPIDRSDVHIYRQSYIPAHSELAWILECFTGFGEMSRMTQFKDKSRRLYMKHARGSITPPLINEEQSKADIAELDLKGQAASESVSVGLFNYPVLMACDILLYGARYVPVGDDQTQHIEFTRDIGQRMNDKFGDLFTLPYEVKKQHEFFGKDQGLRIMDLQDPSKKMSKSDDTGKGVIFLSDSPDEARKKVMSATTDSEASIIYNPDSQPGIANLLQIYGLLTGKTAEVAAKEFEGQTQYGEFKKAVADIVVGFLKDFQQKLANVDQSIVDTKLATSEKAMNEMANTTLLKVQRAVGLRP